MKYFTILVTVLVLSACNSTPKVEVTKKVIAESSLTDSSDYNQFLKSTYDSSKLVVDADLKFWSAKYEKDTANFIALMNMAGSYSYYFSADANIIDLKKSEKFLISANLKTNYNKAGYLRALAKNYISQHKFKEALELLEKAELNGENIENTKKMLFDVLLELGNSEKAEKYLSQFINMNDFTYLIRTSKWNDHEGNLEAAIKYLEKAIVKAEETNNKVLMAWCYTNIADYYGHAGEIDKSYSHYLKALQLNANNAYAKKGIAWIVYSKERNSTEANRILDEIIKTNLTPDYFLLKSEIADFEGKEEVKNEEIKKYMNHISNPLYGDMYNKYKILLFADELKNPEKAIEIAKLEVANRPTTQSYDLLAWSYFKNGELDMAWEISSTKVYNKTFEPEPLLHVAQIAKVKGEIAIVKELKAELEGAFYELGPLAEKTIKQL